MIGLREVECEGGVYYVAETAVVHPEAVIGAGTKIWHGARVMGGSAIGASCVIGANVGIEGATIGDYCKVQTGNTLYNGVVASDYVFFGPNVTTTNDHNPRAFGDWDLTETRIGIGASIGANATLIAGHDIGDLALVGAGSVVTRRVEAGTVVVGNPAEFLGWVDVGGHLISRDRDHRPASIDEILRDPRVAVVRSLQKSRKE